MSALTLTLLYILCVSVQKCCCLPVCSICWLVFSPTQCILVLVFVYYFYSIFHFSVCSQSAFITFLGSHRVFFSFVSGYLFLDAEIHYVNMTALTKGHLLSSFWVVDKRHFYIGSASMDWKSLATVSKILHTITHTPSHASIPKKQRLW